MGTWCEKVLSIERVKRSQNYQRYQWVKTTENKTQKQKPRSQGQIKLGACQESELGLVRKPMVGLHQPSVEMWSDHSTELWSIGRWPSLSPKHTLCPLTLALSVFVSVFDSVILFWFWTPSGRHLFISIIHFKVDIYIFLFNVCLIVFSPYMGGKSSHYPMATHYWSWYNDILGDICHRTKSNHIGRQ